MRNSSVEGIKVPLGQPKFVRKDSSTVKHSKNFDSKEGTVEVIIPQTGAKEPQPNIANFLGSLELMNDTSEFNLDKKELSTSAYQTKFGVDIQRGSKDFSIQENNDYTEIQTQTMFVEEPVTSRRETSREIPMIIQ